MCVYVQQKHLLKCNIKSEQNINWNKKHCASPDNGKLKSIYILLQTYPMILNEKQ